MNNVIEFGDIVVTKLKEGVYGRNDVFVCLYNNMYGRVVGERPKYHEYAVRFDELDNTLFFHKDELEVVK